MNKVLSRLLALGLLVMCTTAYAQNSDQGNNSNNNKLGPYTKLTTINIPGGLTGFDISWVDSKHARYYLASRGNAAASPPIAPNIPVIDTESLELIDQIFLTNAPNGVVAIHRTGNGQGAPGAGTIVTGTTPNAGEHSAVLFIDLDHPHAPPVAVSTGGAVNCLNPAPPHAAQPCRADELAYDPRDHIILVANDRAADLFVTFISTENPPHVLGKIFYNGSTPGNPIACTNAADGSTCGIEQPVWNKKTKRFYIAIPSTTTNPNGEVDEIDPNATPVSPADTRGKITRRFPTSGGSTGTCGPAGLVLIPGQRLMTSCGDVLDIASGKVVHTVAGVGADEIWFNPGDDRVYFGRTTPFIVSGVPPYTLIGTLPTGPLPTGPVPPAATTHSIAADRENNRIFVPFTNLPIPNQAVMVFTADVDKGNGQ